MNRARQKRRWNAWERYRSRCARLTFEGHITGGYIQYCRERTAAEIRRVLSRDYYVGGDRWYSR